MTVLTSYTEFTVLEAQEQFEESVDLILLPEVVGTDALRRLTYPGDIFAALDYPDNPDEWENFDTTPITARPMMRAEMTLQNTVLTRWSGYQKDRPIVERWKGDGSKSRMLMYYVRRFLEYYMNPPISGYVTWAPRDLSDTVYNIEIEKFTVDGQDLTKFNYFAHRGGITLGTIEFTFRIVGEV